MLINISQSVGFGLCFDKDLPTPNKFPFPMDYWFCLGFGYGFGLSVTFYFVSLCDGTGAIFCINKTPSHVLVFTFLGFCLSPSLQLDIGLGPSLCYGLTSDLFLCNDL